MISCKKTGCTDPDALNYVQSASKDDHSCYYFWIGQKSQGGRVFYINPSKKHGLKTHLDGARLWNALVKTNQNPKDYSKWFDSISVCFSKGLGCPVGSVLLGNKDFIDAARKHRKRFGGGMRQAGYLAAACIYALQNNITRLAEDHQKALKFEAILKSLPAVKEVMQVQTNIVLFKTESVEKANIYLQLLKEQNILAAATGGGWIRFVTHLDISDEMMEKVVGVLKDILI